MPPHSVLLVLDATTGQNALQQVNVFKEMVDVTGLVVTKLDGSARGGIVGGAGAGIRPCRCMRWAWASRRPTCGRLIRWSMPGGWLGAA